MAFILPVAAILAIFLKPELHATLAASVCYSSLTLLLRLDAAIPLGILAGSYWHSGQPGLILCWSSRIHWFSCYPVSSRHSPYYQQCCNCRPLAAIQVYGRFSCGNIDRTNRWSGDHIRFGCTVILASSCPFSFAGRSGIRD